MKELIEFQTEDGMTVYVESAGPESIRGDAPHADMERAPRPGELVETASETFEASLRKVKPIAATVYRTLRELNHPDELGIEFGIKLTAGAGVILASASAEAHLLIKMVWKRPTAQPIADQPSGTPAADPLRP